MSTKIKKIGSDSNNRITVRLNTDKLDAIEKEMGRHFVAQVGVLGVKAGRESKLAGESSKQYATRVKKIQKQKAESSSHSDMSNADIGLIHEKGSPAKHIPRRSFLEVPLTTRMPAMMQRVGKHLMDGLKEFNIELAYKRLADIGEGIVHQAFPTGGFGLWPAKANGEPSRLTKTAQLKQSISSRVVSK